MNAYGEGGGSNWAVGGGAARGSDILQGSQISNLNTL